MKPNSLHLKQIITEISKHALTGRTALKETRISEFLPVNLKILPWHEKAASEMGGEFSDISEIVPFLTNIIAKNDPEARGKILSWHKAAAAAVSKTPPLEDFDDYDDTDPRFYDITDEKLSAAAIAKNDPKTSKKGGHQAVFTISYLRHEFKVPAATKKEALEKFVKTLKVSNE